MKQIRTPLTGTPLHHFPQQSMAQTATGLPDIMPLQPADELAQIRKALVKLHARELELREFFRDDASDQDLTGDTHVVTVTRHHKKSFDASLLPQAILANPKFYRTEAQTYVDTQQKPRGIPFQALLPGVIESEVDELAAFEVIEAETTAH